MPDEADALNGLTPGFSSAFGKLDISSKDRLRLTGQCLNQFHLRILFRYVNMVQAEQQTKMVMQIRSPACEANPEALELHLTNMSHDEKDSGFVRNCLGFKNQN